MDRSHVYTRDGDSSKPKIPLSTGSVVVTCLSSFPHSCRRELPPPRRAVGRAFVTVAQASPLSQVPGACAFTHRHASVPLPFPAGPGIGPRSVPGKEGLEYSDGVF